MLAVVGIYLITEQHDEAQRIVRIFGPKTTQVFEFIEDAARMFAFGSKT